MTKEQEQKYIQLIKDLKLPNDQYGCPADDVCIKAAQAIKELLDIVKGIKNDSHY